MIESVDIADESVGDAAQVQQPLPLGVVACHSRCFAAEEDADLAHRDFIGHLGEARANDHARGAVRQILIDNFDLSFRPAQLDRPLVQLVLEISGLAVHQHLRGRGLADVHVGTASQMGVLNLRIIAHGFESALRVEEGLGEEPGPV